MDKFQFIKHPIKENDTIESVAQHFDITTNYLQLVHNLNVAIYEHKGLKNPKEYNDYIKGVEHFVFTDNI